MSEDEIKAVGQLTKDFTDYLCRDEGLVSGYRLVPLLAEIFVWLNKIEGKSLHEMLEGK